MWLKSENKASNNANLAKLNLEKSSGTDVEACFNLKNIKTLVSGQFRAKVEKICWDTPLYS